MFKMRGGEPQERLQASGFTPEPTHNHEAAMLVQQQIEEEVERILQEPTIETLCELFDPQELVSANVTHMWRHNQLRPEYKDFIHRWAQPDRWERADVGFWYAYWHQEKKILERIAGHRGIVLGSATSDDAPVRLYSTHHPAAQTDVEARVHEQISYLPQRKRSAASTVLVAFWRWGRHGFDAVFFKPGDLEVITVDWTKCKLRKKERSMITA